MTGQTHITPKTEESLKRLAKRIARERGVPHMAALDLAARQAGVDSYRTFQKGLRDQRLLEPASSARITVNWSEYGPDRRRLISAGVAEAEVRLPRPFRDIFPGTGEWKSDRANTKHVGEGRFSAHAGDRRQAFEWALRTARALQFMAATGLRRGRWPARGPWVKLGGGSCGQFAGVPGQDHTSFYRDPATRRLLMINEPYASDTFWAEERENWKRADLFDVRPLSWGSLYIAGGPIRSELISLKGHGVDLDEVEARLVAFGPAMRREEVRVTVTKGTPAPDRYWPEMA